MFVFYFAVDDLSFRCIYGYKVGKIKVGCKIFSRNWPGMKIKSMNMQSSKHTGKLKGLVHSNTLNALQRKFKKHITAIPQTELQCMLHSLLNQELRYFHVGREHFQYLL